MLEPADQTPVLRRLGKVLELAGRWADAEAIFQMRMVTPFASFLDFLL